MPATLSDDAKECVVRAVREGLTNIAQHARAQQVWIEAKSEGAALAIDVRDDGRGFDLASIPPGHYGLLGIRERARLAGGELQVASSPNGGTSLRLRLPIGEDVVDHAAEPLPQAALERHLTP
ncbi:MAG: ATP-binding protein [Chloroflexi bacterium]|nr:ATP-binding protein [Chloroflexota bacterium]